MSTATAARAGVASDLGLKRTVNEDRVFADEGRGIFLVVDGLGGHAAGEVAAETAVQAIAERLRSFALAGDAESAIRQAITEANNGIFELAATRSECHGMACVLTLAVVQEERVTVGHVGDSRLYLTWNGHLKKLTSDHSPVGEQEDGGRLTEEEAMHHPRRNEVFRDVGSHPHGPDDPQFIDIQSFRFRPDAALLLSSDGLSDALTSAQIGAILEGYDGAPEKTAQQLIEAANEAGGNDNISVIFVPGPEFLGSRSGTLAEARPRHAITRMRGDESVRRPAVRNALWLLAGLLMGMALGIALWPGFKELTRKAEAPQTKSPILRLRPPIVVDAADSHGIQKGLDTALPGDTIEVPAGDYLGPIKLKDHVNVVGGMPGQVNVRTDPHSASDPGIAVLARSVRGARIEGLRILADQTHPLRVGVWISDSSVEVANLDITGAIEAGIQIDASSRPILLANIIHANSGPGVMIKRGGEPRLMGNWIVENGKVPQALRPGIEVEGNARPEFENNFVQRNGVASKLGEDPLLKRSK